MTRVSVRPGMLESSRKNRGMVSLSGVAMAGDGKRHLPAHTAAEKLHPWMKHAGEFVSFQLDA